MFPFIKNKAVEEYLAIPPVFFCLQIKYPELHGYEIKNFLITHS